MLFQIGVLGSLAVTLKVLWPHENGIHNVCRICKDIDHLSPPMQTFNSDQLYDSEDWLRQSIASVSSIFQEDEDVQSGSTPTPMYVIMHTSSAKQDDRYTGLTPKSSALSMKNMPLLSDLYGPWD